MRQRTFKEGSVGLLLLLGMASFGGLALWLGGLTLGKKSYSFLINFQEAEGMREGTPVSYRGVEVGRVTKINANPREVAVTVQVSPPDVIIPRQGIVVRATQAGLIGEASINISSAAPVDLSSDVAKPLDKNCNSDLIICENSVIQGVSEANFTKLIQSVVDITKVVNNPEFFNNLNTLVKNSADATAGVSGLTKELGSLSQSVREELRGFSQNANNLTVKATEIGDSVDQVVNQVGGLTGQFSGTANEFSAAANQLRLSGEQAERLITNVNGLVLSNRSNLVATLDNLNFTSQELRAAVGGLTPILQQVEGAEFVRNLEVLSANAAETSANFRRLSEGQTVRNLETVTANAAQASANLKQLSDPSNLVALQQTLESARVVFQNAEKITSDLDELTGDPEFRINIRRLVNGLSGLVSSTQQLQQQIQVAESVAPLQGTMERLAEDAQLKKQQVPVSSQPHNDEVSQNYP